MSGNETQKINLAGYNINEWSLIILIMAIALTFVVFAIGLASAMLSGNNTVSFSGEIDLGQFTGVIIGIAITATVLVSQKLTSRQQAAAVAQTDEVWMNEK